MHPILATRWRTLFYLAGWMPILALLDYLMWASGGASWVQNTAVLAPACFLFAFACLSPWPMCRVRPLRLADAAMLAVTWAAAAAAASALFTGAAWAMARLEGRPAAHLDLLFGVGILLYLLSAGLHYAALAAEESREASVRAAEAHSLARDAELHALRMQINPHFLFNSLHSIAALATVDGARAREMCIRLADFLRSSLGLGERESIPLREELALARSYLEVEQVRFGARLRFSEDIEESCQDCAVPVLLLQPLVENAVKHGIAGLVEGGADTAVGGALRRRTCAWRWRTGLTRTLRRPTGSAWDCPTCAAAWNCAMAIAPASKPAGAKASIAWSCDSPANLPSPPAAARSRSGSPAAACRRSEWRCGFPSRRARCAPRAPG